MVKTIVFDIGNVLIRWDPEHLYRQLIPDDGERHHFLTEILPPSWNLEQDRGRAWREAEDERIALHPDKADLIRAFRARWHEMIPGEIPENVATLAALKAQDHPLYAITNFAGDTFAEAQARFAFLKEDFMGIVVSAHESLLKPDPRIYHCFLERYDQRAEACLFIDDSAANIAGAAALGFSTIHVAPTTHLPTELARFGFAV